MPCRAMQRPGTRTRTPPAITMSAEEIAGAFMQHYYGTLDSNIAGLGPLYVSGAVERSVSQGGRTGWLD